MGAPIGPGDYVECVYNAPLDVSRGVRAGGIYLCESIETTSGPCTLDGCECLEGMTLRGVGPGVYGPVWCPCGFRPIYRPDPKLIERLLTEPVSLSPLKVEA